ncbi:hypothetical protein RUM43_009745 [Polyplax serrata]|uniref:Low-density lipoprotein receptor-related protein 11 n=1 Tax=Polyplax serrata TaxID=468196 RepID=A0AAN8NZF1_POLSC
MSVVTLTLKMRYKTFNRLRHTWQDEFERSKKPRRTQKLMEPLVSESQQCSRYQFECRASGECIAIYNACDGIPQCSDGSDEAPELDCPTISGIKRNNLSGSTHPKTFHDQLQKLKASNENIDSPSQPEKVPENPVVPPAPGKPIKPAAAKVQTSLTQQVPLQSSSSSVGYFQPGAGYVQQNEQANESSRSKLDSSQPVSTQARYYGREGEIVQYPQVNGAQWQGYQPQRQDDSNYVFNHKGSGLAPENGDSQFPGPYNNDMNHFDYVKYAAGSANNGYYGGTGPIYYPGPNGWMQRMPQHQHGVEDVPQRPVMPLYGNGMSGSVPSDYYYEDSQLRGRFPPPPQDPHRMTNFDILHMSQKNVAPEPVSAEENAKTQENPKKTESRKKALESPSPSTAAAPEKLDTTTVTTSTSVREEKVQHHEAPKVGEHLKMTQAEGKDMDGVNERPSGAILSLTLGMCITAIMITLVGCRLRVVRKRMRRNGKSAYAHDADFLVNGMYL